MHTGILIIIISVSSGRVLKLNLGNRKSAGKFFFLYDEKIVGGTN
jgi:hypothetical protein